MISSRKRIYLYLGSTVPVGVAGCIWAFSGLPATTLGPGIAAFAFVTVFLSSFLRIQLPRTNIYLTISDTLIILSFLLYGGEVALLLSVAEALFSCFRMKQKGDKMRPSTVILNANIAATSVFLTAYVAFTIFGSVPAVVQGGVSTQFFMLLMTMAATQFLTNSIMVAYAISVRTGETIWQVWNGSFLNVLVMYLAGSIMAGAVVIAIREINFILFGVVLGIFALVYVTYRRYLSDISETSAKAESAERQRAEQAENHLDELRHYVDELERSSFALKESREEFRHAAFHDALTGLPNRQQFRSTLRRYYRVIEVQTRRNSQCCSWT